MIPNPLKSFALLIASAGLAGCLTSDVLVTVRPDGSGTIEHTAKMRPAAMADLEKLLAPEVAGRPAVPAIPASEREKLLWAARWGQGVRLRSVRPLNTADTLGWKALYDFDHVEQIGVDLLPGMPGIPGFYHIAAADTTASTRLRMTLEPVAGGLERLTVRFPRFAMDPAAEPLSASASGSPAEMAGLRGVLRGSRTTVAIQTEAPLLRTNSPHHELNRVTLFDVDVETALFSKQIDMLVSGPASFDDLLWAIEVLPGVTLAHDHDVTLEFQDPAAQATAPARTQAQPPPDTEIFLATLSRAGGKLVIGAPANITGSPGYDNQPSFTPDGQQILFTSVRGTLPPSLAASVPAGAVQTDIYRYDIRSRRISRVTQTPESEYSPAVMPDGAHISVVRVEADGTQRLWSVIPSGPKISLSLVLPDVKPVGYYAWVDDRTVALFILGERGQPATLQIADAQTGKAELAATGIGRSIQRMPSGQISFVQLERGAEGTPVSPTVKLLNTRPREGGSIGIATLVLPVEGATDPQLAWTPDGTLLMAHGDTLYSWRAGDAGWAAVARLDELGLRSVSRLAVSPKGDRLALVGQQR
jgi:hypothetical protein